MNLAAILLLAIVLIMATLDPHPIESGKSTSFLTKAAYIKIFVHFVSGGMLFALFTRGGLSDAEAVWWTIGAGALYEVVQWLNPRGRWRGGVYTIAEAFAVAFGAVVILSWGAVWR